MHQCRRCIGRYHYREPSYLCSAGAKPDQHSHVGALADKSACSSDDEESVDICIVDTSAKAHDPDIAAGQAADNAMGIPECSIAEHAQPPAATAAATSATAEPADQPDAKAALLEQEAPTRRPGAAEQSEAASITPDAAELHGGHILPVSGQVAPDAAAEEVTEAVQPGNDMGVPIQQPADRGVLNSSSLDNQAAASLHSAACMQEPSAERQPAYQPAVSSSSAPEQQAEAADLAFEGKSASPPQVWDSSNTPLR
jgi:hypothetical protein